MTIGDHLEELRTRLVLGLLGFVAVFLVFMIPAVGEHIVKIFCRPLALAYQHNHQPWNIIYTTVEESFMVFTRICIVSAIALASPWMVYQLWQFVAAGLYPHERKYITKYLPLRITLLVAGMFFLYFFVLPLMLEFFLAFNLGEAPTFPSPEALHSSTTRPALVIPTVEGTPKDVLEGQIWFDRTEGRLKLYYDAQVRTLTFGSDKLATPLIKLNDYIDMVVGMLLSFGLAFQMPLVVMALVRIGIMEIATLKRMRRIVYFAMTLLAAFIVPDVATGMIALLVPLCLLYEFGIFLAQMGIRKAEREEAAKD